MVQSYVQGHDGRIKMFCGLRMGGFVDVRLFSLKNWKTAELTRYDTGSFSGLQFFSSPECGYLAQTIISGFATHVPAGYF